MTQCTWDNLLGPGRDSTWVFTVMGILITMLAGIGAAFKLEVRRLHYTEDDGGRTDTPSPMDRPYTA